MDGFLQQSTVDLIKMIRGSDDVTVHQNTFRPYEGMECELSICNSMLLIQKSIHDDLQHYAIEKGQRVVVNVLSRALA